jgi:tRNA G18 (ribose-2'-O)-methylase SpoU
MAGKKESFNVAAAAAMALYQLDLADLDRTAA